MKKLWLSLLVLALSSATVGTAYAASGGSDLPFHMRGSGTSFVEFSFTIRGTYVGTGTFTGSSTVFGSAGSCPDGGAPFISTGTITAADGATLQETVSGTVCFRGPTATHATGTYTITGETGRFATATGNGTLTSDGDVSAGMLATFTEDGTISL